jgi:serine/threonine protein kinase
MPAGAARHPVQNIGKYRVEKVLGSGAMGTVYQALDPVLHRTVAVKTMTPGLSDEAEQRARFLREAQAAGSLRHHNIVTVYDHGEDGGQPYIAMELVEGVDLEAVIRSREPLPVEAKIDILRQVCEGLSCAHRSGIVHRDVKPANIRVTPDGDVKIMDFGIAHLQSSTMTRGGAVLGTVHYMAPEQVEGRKADHRADIFSVGAIAYELLAYRRPFDAETLTSVMFRITHDVPDMAAIPPSANSPRLEAVVQRALAKAPSDRYQTLDEMRDDLARLVRDTAASEVEATTREKEVEELVGMSLAYAADGDLDLATRIADRVGRIAPGSERSRALAGYLAEEGDRLAAEARAAAAAQGLVRRRVEAATLASAALDHFLRNDHRRARSVGEEALALDPGNRRAQGLLEVLATLG